jgi:hypothetical protein
MNKNILFASLIVLFVAVMACEKVVCPDPAPDNTCQLTNSKFYFFDITPPATSLVLPIPGRTVDL